MLALLALALSLVIAAAMAISRERQSTRYPGATTVAAMTNYQGLPYHISRDTTYHTAAPFDDVYDWYLTGFDLRTSRLTTGGCVVLTGSTRWVFIVRHMNVVLCTGPNGQMIFVTRSTSLR